MNAIRLLALLATLAVNDPHLTPGAVRPLKVAQVCDTKWGLDARHVSRALKRRVAAIYRIPEAQLGGYVFDHVIPRELAGADTDDNIWLQPKAEATQKDRLENRLHRLVCAPKPTLTLAAAQNAIRRDWPAAYQVYVVKR